MLTIANESLGHTLRGHHSGWVAIPLSFAVKTSPVAPALSNPSLVIGTHDFSCAQKHETEVDFDAYDRKRKLWTYIKGPPFGVDGHTSELRRENEPQTQAVAQALSNPSLVIGTHDFS